MSSSSSSTGSTSSTSGTDTSCTDSGGGSGGGSGTGSGSSSDSESSVSSSVEDKLGSSTPNNVNINNNSNRKSKNGDMITKSMVTTRRKSSEIKLAAAVTGSGPNAATTKQTENEKTPLKKGATNQRHTRNHSNVSSDDEATAPPNKKITRQTSTNQSSTTTTSSAVRQTRKLSQSSAAPPSTGAIPKATTALLANGKKSTSNKRNSTVPLRSSSKTGTDKTDKDLKASSIFSPNHITDDEDDKEPLLPYSSQKKDLKGRSKATPIASPARTTRSRALSKPTPPTSAVKTTGQDINSKKAPTPGQSDGDSSESGSGSSGSLTSSSESDASSSSNSFSSQHLKAVKGKKAPAKPKFRPSESEDNKTQCKSETPQRTTRSFANRRKSRHLQRRTGGIIGGSDSESEPDNENRSPAKSPAKRPGLSLLSISRNKVKNNLGNHVGIKLRSPSPPIDNRCPVEGCDSSGHLGGNLDSHFLPEACPIYHNVSISACKERAKERQIYMQSEEKEIDEKVKIEEPKLVLAYDVDVLNKIREDNKNNYHFPSDNMILENGCEDEREPSLEGLAPDYDLQLFREAQAIASEKMEEEFRDLQVGKGIKYIIMGKYKMKVWYQSPYPEDAARLPKLYICEFCLRYRNSEVSIKRHAQKCIWRHPPGDEIYRKGKLQVFQVDGKRQKLYCQNLCLLAKFFLDHKTLYYDVEPFLFYIMTLADVDGCHTVGYFSKEKNSFYNVSCILTLPPYQRKGYGRLLIDFSYLLTRVEGKIGSPEKPLSDLGLISYRSYWKDEILEYLCNRTGNSLSIKDVSQEMAIYSYDIVSTLQALGMMKYWKGKHIVLKKQDVLDEYQDRIRRRGHFPKIDEACLRWRPFVPPSSPNSCT